MKCYMNVIAREHPPRDQCEPKSDELWAREKTGVGKSKAFPLWDGPGTVKVVLLDNEMRSPTSSVVESVQQYIDPTMDGMGEGTAPVWLGCNCRRRS